MVHHNVYVINAPLKTKNSSDTQPREKSQKEIIDEWIVGYMNKRQILGTHWENNLADKQKCFLEIAFQMMKESKLENNSELTSVQQKTNRFCSIFQKLQKNCMKKCFDAIK